MANVKIISKSFEGSDGKPVSYERLAIIGSIQGVTHTLELKVSTAELLAAKMLLSSEEKLDVNSRPATNGERVEVTRKPQSDDLFNLDEE